MRKIVLFGAMVLVTFLQTVSAHGGEESEGLSNLQIMLTSLSASVVFFIIYKKIPNLGANPNEKITLTLVLYTGVVHVLLGINDFIFLLGGFGVILIAILPYFSNFAKARKGLVQVMLGTAVITMFIAYFVSNHDLHYIAEDYLGITTKLAEVGIIGLMLKQYKE